jgi:hypothetical protein
MNGCREQKLPRGSSSLHMLDHRCWVRIEQSVKALRISLLSDNKIQDWRAFGPRLVDALLGRNYGGRWIFNNVPA